MKRPGRKLSSEEAEVWSKVTRTVTPLARRTSVPAADGKDEAKGSGATPPAAASSPVVRKVKGRVPPALPLKPVPPKAKGEAGLHLDGSWEKRISKGTLVPDFSLDLHGCNLDAAYQRLMHGLAQARAMGARVVLVVTGKPRSVDAMDRGERRGAIRAKVSDWLAASEHAGDIVAIRAAHRRHGGPGAIYIVLKRR